MGGGGRRNFEMAFPRSESTRRSLLLKVLRPRMRWRERLLFRWRARTSRRCRSWEQPLQIQVYRQVARMLTKVLRGAKPADLPDRTFGQ
jgi:hypothetical protein